MWPLVFLIYILRNGARMTMRHWDGVAYALVFILFFMFLYWKIGMEDHFFVPDYIDKKKRNSLTTALYTAVLAQSNAMPDTVPRTTLARMLFMTQVCTGWMWFLIFNSPILAA